jgi:pimeloyl-ACP methyl ester carboxylesterase
MPEIPSDAPRQTIAAAPGSVDVAFHPSPYGRIRSRAVGEVRPGVPELALVMGMAVSDYLLPGLAAFGSWTRAHLVDLPGYAGSGDPPRPLDVPGYGEAVAYWLDAVLPGPVVLAGHSSGTQVAARAALRRPQSVAGLVLASPTIDPVARSWTRLFVRWRLDGRHEPPGLSRSHRKEWKRAGVRRLLHTVRIHLADHLEDAVGAIELPLLVLRGREDRLSTRDWARQLAESSPAGRLVDMPGAHTFPWAEPEAWSAPVRAFCSEVAGRA